MCGIVGATAERNVPSILIEGLKRLEYRGYDSAGLAVLDAQGALANRRQVGKVQALVDELDGNAIRGTTGIAHTRWATHGEPATINAHPHVSQDRVAVVHNGIIENHESLRARLESQGFEFASQTDSEVIAHLIAHHLGNNASLLEAVHQAISELEGAYSIGVISSDSPSTIVAARAGSPLVIGKGIGENFLASDVLALKAVTDRFIYLEEGDIVALSPSSVNFYSESLEPIEREAVTLELGFDEVDKGNYRHFMQKEIFEQPNTVRRTLSGRLGKAKVLEAALGAGAGSLLDQIDNVQIVACGTSFYAASVGRYWLEEIANIGCQVEIASEFRYRTAKVMPNSLFITLSQSGETADTLAALRCIKDRGFAATLTICNVPTSSLVRESELALLMEAGTEVGVASTKAFTAQLVALLLITILIGRRHGLSEADENKLVAELQQLDSLIEEVLRLDTEISLLAERFVDCDNALFLGRGPHYPIALEGALKMKELSYIHAEGYPAGELKHGPLALVDDDMPVFAVAPNDELQEKLRSNLQEVRARGGQLIVFAEEDTGFPAEDGVTVINLPTVPPILAPIVYTIPLQLLAYHVARHKGTDVDQPRNLAKSVTVE